MRKMSGKPNKGFTLVELIVVLVILAILAALLAPALLGYIDKARDKEDMLNARNCLMAAQAEFTYNYAQRTDSDNKAVKKELNITDTGKKEGDVGRDTYMEGSNFSKRVLATADDNPYVFIVGLPNYKKYAIDGNDPKRAYTVQFAIYQKTPTSKPIFYDGHQWTKEYPWDAKGDKNGKDNIFEINGESVQLSMYIIRDGYKNEETMWKKLQTKARE